MQPDGIVERLWPGRDAAVEPLGGGITNRNFKVDLGDETYVLRVGGKDTELLGIDRRAEHEASLVAAGLGIAPEVIAFVEPEGYLVTRYVPGEPVAAERLRDRDMIGSIARMLRRFHNSGRIAASFDPFRVVEAYRDTAASRGVRIPAGYARAKAIADMIERLIPPHPEMLCHNDLLNANFIADLNGRIWLVDWEYAGMGDRFFDLANFAVNHGLDADDDAALLASYGVEDERSLIQMRFMSDFREAMWGVVQQALSDIAFDFEGYAAEHFRRMEETADSERFRKALL
ncbi:MAG: phosphotransferase [Pseudomonadota bacterium]